MRPRLTARAALATALLTAPLTALLTALTALAPAPAHAQDPAFRVVAVPWVPTNPAIPHDGVAGQPHYLQAVADHCPAGPITLRWDYDGDGRYDMPATPAPDRWNLGAQHTYNPAETRLYYPRVEARCADATATAQMPLRIHVAPPLQIRINRAISNGLWIGHAQLIRDPATLRASFGAGDRVADSAALAQAMINRGHRAGADPATTPYLADVQWQLHTALAGMVRRSIRARQAGADTDLNGNGDGLRFAASENYVGGGVLEALASYGDLRYVPPPQTALPGAVVGRALGEVVQDAAEYFAWSQSEIPFNGAHAGGWSYAANSDDIDSSHVGWAAVGLFAAQRVGGAQIPDFVAERLYQGVLHNDTSRGGNEALRGGYVYRFGNDTGPSYARSGAMLNALGYATDRDPTDPQVQATVGLISRQWGRNFVTDYWDGTNLGNYYAMHQIAKGMRSFEPAFEYIGDAGVDWYADYATFLVDTQPANARWINDHQWTRDREITHALGLLVLIPTLFEAIPTAVPQGAPLAIGPDDPVTFTHAESYALDPLNPIVMYRWDFVRAPDGLDLNADGRFDAPNEIEPEDLDGDGRVSDEETHWEIETADPTFRPVWRFPLTAGPQQTYEVRLQVEDTLGRTHTDRHTITVTVSTTNHPPVAVPHPQPGAEYLATPGQMLRLDAAQSYDPDTDDPPVPGFPRDALTTTWDLDGDGVFETPGPITQLAIPPDWADGLTRIIRLRACDDGRWIGQSDAQCGGDCSLCHTADARIRVALRPDAIVEPATTLLEGDQIEIDGDRSNHPRAQPYTLTWTLDPRLPYTLGPGGRSILIDATQIDGPQTFNGTLTATTAGLTDTAPFTITVQNRAPTITVRAGGRALEGTTLIWTTPAPNPTPSPGPSTPASPTPSAPAAARSSSTPPRSTAPRPSTAPSPPPPPDSPTPPPSPSPCKTAPRRSPCAPGAEPLKARR